MELSNTVTSPFANCNNFLKIAGNGHNSYPNNVDIKLLM